MARKGWWLTISIALNLSTIDRIFQVTNTEELCQQYIGLDFKAKGRKMWACCPAHGENTPSLCLYPDGKLYCFGCHFKGDALDLIGVVLGLPLPAVLKMVAVDYGLANNTDADYRQEISNKIIRDRKQKEQVEKFKQQVNDSFIYLVGVSHQLRKIERNIKNMDDLGRDDVVMAFELMPVIEGIMDLLIDSNIDKQNKGLLWGRRLNLW